MVDLWGLPQRIGGISYAAASLEPGGSARRSQKIGKSVHVGIPRLDTFNQTSMFRLTFARGGACSKTGLYFMV